VSVSGAVNGLASAGVFLILCVWEMSVVTTECKVKVILSAMVQSYVRSDESVEVTCHGC